MAGAVVALDAAAWRAAYPQFAEVTDAQVELWWAMATQLVDNGPGSPIPYDPDAGVTTRQTILWVVMCHLATLDARGDMVGRVASAAEGSVNTSLASGLDGSRAAAWWTQTRCGATAWQLLTAYRAGGMWFHGCKR